MWSIQRVEWALAVILGRGVINGIQSPLSRIHDSYGLKAWTGYAWLQ
jgi:hypothetical protein